jgi:hypothetical protein
MTTDSHRLSILTAREIDVLYGLPRFADEDRHLYFGLSVPEREAVHTHTDSVAVHLTLQIGYFKAKQQFFLYKQDMVLDENGAKIRNFWDVCGGRVCGLPVPIRGGLAD